MTRSKIVPVRRLHVATFCTILGIGACATVSAPASAQQRDASAMWSWVDQYYADYTAMSAAPTGPAMDKWLAHYAPDAFFEDPTAGLSGTGHERIRKPYVEAFTGPLGPVHWTILRRVTSGDWTVVEGWVDGTLTGKPIRARFTTWLEIRNGKIIHQIDYVDYAAFRRPAEPLRDTASTSVRAEAGVIPSGGRAAAAVEESRPPRPGGPSLTYHRDSSTAPASPAPLGMTLAATSSRNDTRRCHKLGLGRLASPPKAP